MGSQRTCIYGVRTGFFESLRATNLSTGTIMIMVIIKSRNISTVDLGIFPLVN